MYSFEVGRKAKGRARTSVPPVVYWVGLSSLLADICAESVASALPIFLFSVLQLSPLEVGFLDGIYQGGAALVRVAAAYVADRRRSNRAVALLGYTLSALARVGFLLSGSLGLLVAMLSLCMDRVGKGIRTAPRDAIIAGHTEAANMAAAFGVHRSMDAVGALLGPLIGAAILWALPFRFDWLFAASLLFGMLGVAVFVARVPEPRLVAADATPAPAAPSFRSTLGLVLSDKPFVQLTVLAALLSVFTISDSLVYLSLQKEAGIDERHVPLMFALTALCFLATAASLGKAADSIGTVPVFLAGYGLLALLYLWLAFWPNHDWRSAMTIVGLLGVHYAATDGILAAAAARMLDASVRTTGLAFLATAVGLTRIGASSLYGWLWQSQGQHAALSLFAFGMLGCCAMASLLSKRYRGQPLSPVLP